jgi:hypothetical protein
VPATDNHRHAQSLRSLVLPILAFNRTVTECLYACLPTLYSKPRPRDPLSVGANHFRERGGVPNKLATECTYQHYSMGLEWSFLQNIQQTNTYTAYLSHSQLYHMSQYIAMQRNSDGVAYFLLSPGCIRWIIATLSTFDCLFSWRDYKGVQYVICSLVYAFSSHL